MSKIAAIILFFVILLLGLNFAFTPSSKVEITESSYECAESICSYQFKLTNLTEEFQAGKVAIHIRENGSPVSYKVESSKLGFVEHAYNLEPYEVETISGQYHTTKTVELFFRLYAN